MAKVTAELVTALRATAVRLQDNTVTYRWSSFAHCNCGHLVQTLTGMSPSEVQRRAVRTEGDWGEQARAEQQRRQLFPQPDYGDRPALDEGAWEPENVGACSVTGTPLDLVFEQLHTIGLNAEDIGHLERLSDPEVRRQMGNNTSDFLHYKRENVVAYLLAWADLLAAQLPEEQLPLAAE